MDRQDQTRIATAVSEIARNAFIYAGGGKAEFYVTRSPRLALRIVVRDSGPGIRDLASIWAGTYKSATGMGMGLLGSKRISDEFEVLSGPTGTVVSIVKYAALQTSATKVPTDEALTRTLAASRPADPTAILSDQNQELLQLLEQLRTRETELERLNRELEETNRGVMVLYSELEDKAKAVQQANEMKSRFLSSVTHELRTPLNSIVSLSRLLLHHEDGDLNAEQEKQVGFILRSAQNMTEMVNDLLDLAKVEAGKITITPTRVAVAEIFSALRGMFRPIALNDRVELLLEEPEASLVLRTDEGKLAQILRNFVSNGLKFTESGQVTVRAWRDGGTVVFCVADTGVGIAPEDRELVLQEWGQVGAPSAKGQWGSGLGLPLAKRFTELLGGEMWFTSEVGRGSQFFIRLPVGEPVSENDVEGDGSEVIGPILVVDDDEVWRYLLRRQLEDLTTARIVEAPNGRAGLQLVRSLRPSLLVLDLVMPEMSGLEVLQELRRDASFAELKVIVVTSKELTASERASLSGFEADVVGKKETSHEDHQVALERALLGVGLLNLHQREA